MWLQKLGGRKFLLALICVILGSVIDFYTARGLTPALAGLMGAIVTAFSAANYAVSKSHFQSKESGAADSVPVPDTSGIDDVKQVTGQMAEVLIQTKTAVDAIKTILVNAMKQQGEGR